MYKICLDFIKQILSVNSCKLTFNETAYYVLIIDLYN